LRGLDDYRVQLRSHAADPGLRLDILLEDGIASPWRDRFPASYGAPFRTGGTGRPSADDLEPANVRVLIRDQADRYDRLVFAS
jgi:hypothetical protein